MSCPKCGSGALTAFYRVEVAFDYQDGERRTLLTEPSDIRDELQQTERLPFAFRCDDCDHEWTPEDDGLGPKFGDIEITGFAKDADDNWPANTCYLYELRDGQLFEDAEKRL